MYTETDYKTKKAFKEDVLSGKEVRLYAPGLGSPKANGVECVEGPHYPKAHTWYAECMMKDGVVISVK